MRESETKNQFQLNYLTNAYARASAHAHSNRPQTDPRDGYTSMNICVYLSPATTVRMRLLEQFTIFFVSLRFVVSFFFLSFLVSCLVLLAHVSVLLYICLSKSSSSSFPIFRSFHETCTQECIQYYLYSTRIICE